MFTHRELQVMKRMLVEEKGLRKTADELKVSVTRVKALRNRAKLKLLSVD